MESEGQGTHLVRYSERRSLESVSRSYLLSETGFSSQFPEYFQRLNNSMTRLKSRRFPATKSFRITLSPDSENPMPIFEAEFETYDQIQIGGYPQSRRAYLKIGRGDALLTLSELGDVKNVVKELFPENKSAKLYWSPKVTIGKPIPETNPIEEEFYGLTTARLGELPLHTYELQVGLENNALFLISPYHDRQFIEAICGIHGFLFQAEPKEVERAMDLLSQLFDKNPFNNPGLLKPRS